MSEIFWTVFTLKESLVWEWWWEKDGLIAVSAKIQKIKYKNYI